MPFVALHHAHSTDTERNKHTTRVYQPFTHTPTSMLQKYVIIWCTAHMSLHPPKVWPCRQRRISRLKVQPLASKRLQLGKKTSSALRQQTRTNDSVSFLCLYCYTTESCSHSVRFSLSQSLSYRQTDRHTHTHKYTPKLSHKDRYT
jgi:hypothetical protein